MMQHLVVALDGPAGSGKSTVAQRVAAALDATLLDTGAIYRAVALTATQRDIAWDDEPNLVGIAHKLEIRFSLQDGVNRVFLGDVDVSTAIRTPEMSMGASAVSAVPGVRAALLQMQRDFAENGAIVAEGRDMGTVVFPDAPIKLFLTASVAERARRRVEQLREAGQEADYDQIRDAIESRDQADAGRAVAPMAQAADAASLDTTGLSIDQVVSRILELCHRWRTS